MTSRPQRIVYVTTDLLLGGGAEGMLARLTTAEPRLADAITVVSLLPGDSHAEQLRQAGVNVVQLDFSTPWGIASGLLALARLIAAAEPDIVQGWMYHGDLAALTALHLSGRRGRTRLVWSIRCTEVDLRLYGARLRWVVRACVALSRRPDVITANSAAGLASHLALGYRPRRSEVLANGIDTERFKPDPAARARLRADLGISSDAVVLAHIARVDPMKDHAGMQRALAELPDLTALFVGSGTRNLPAMPNARHLGRRDDVEHCLAAADIVVSSSAFGEGFSNVLAEGMACGLPAVATDVGDARDIVGDTGAIVPPRDPERLGQAIRELAAEDAAARARRGARARMRVVERFAMSLAVERFAALYRSLAAGPN